MANSSNIFGVSTLTSDFSQAPYHDDYDPRKNFYKILYRPSYAVQGRELNQMQTYLQKQIDRLGKHIFVEGSIVIPGSFTLYSSVGKNAVPYVKVRDIDINGDDIDINDFLGQQVRGNTNHVIATITDVLDGTEASSNTKTIYVRYDSASNVNTSIKTFQAGETLRTNVGTLLALNTAPTGTASKFSIEDGVFFAKEHFIAFEGQSVILDRYNPLPTCKVGFLVSEEIITEDDDLSLLDPALDSGNYAAPGAHRLKLNPELQVLNYVDPAGPPDFVTLFTIKDGVVQTYYERTQYSIIRDEIAKRTNDESGNYYVHGLNVHLREHLDDGENFGRYTLAQNGNSQLLFVGVEPGTAYVNGYEVNLYDTKELETPKSFEYSNVNSQLSAAVLGSYVRCNEFTGSWEHDKGITIGLYDTAQDRISGKGWSVASQTGTQIGTAKLIGTEYISGTMGYDAVFDVYLSDILMYGSNTFSQVKSIYLNNSPHPDLGADVVLESNVAVLRDVDQVPLYYVGSDYTRKIRSISDDTVSDTTFYFNRSEGTSTPVSIANTGLFTISISPGTEQFPYGTVSDISTTQKKDIQISFDTSINIAGPGTIVATAGETQVVGTNTFFTRFNVGDKFEVSGKGNTFYVAAVANNTHMTAGENMPAGISGNTIYKAYKVGDIVNLSGKGFASGADRTVAATPTQLSFDLKETYPASPSLGATVNYKLARTSAKEVLKTLKPNRAVIINCNTAGVTGPFSLGFSDVYQIRSITKKSGSAPASVSDGTDVKDLFVFNNGQKDTHYDLATITPKTGSGLGATDYLLVILDYFEPDFTSRAGYFSIDSYPIDDANTSNSTIKTEDVPIFKSPTSGEEYNLRNYLDFRPVKSITATDTTTVGSATTNPANTSSFNVPASGLRLPVPSSEIQYDYSYYLARKDLVVVDTKGSFYIIKGVPSRNPITPTAPDNTMVIAVLNITPYPSLSPAYARSIGLRSQASSVRKLAPVRFTMKDIGTLKERIVNLEYYTTLSLLEKAAIDFKVLDENGLDRFKNGVFVDTFRNHVLGATYNPDYRIVVDDIEKSIRPIYTMESFKYNLISNTNIKQTGSILTLTHSEVEYKKQNTATTTRNIERTSYNYVGNLSLYPDQDTWVDTQFAPDELIDLGERVVPDLDFIPDYEQSINITWGAWKKYITGYKVYKGEGDGKEYVGTYTTYDDARAEANKYTRETSVSIETLFNNERLGIEEFLVEGTETNATGNKVIDVNIIPYIRPQTITVMARGLKPYTKMYAFFDGENITDYAAPLTSAQFTALTDGVDSTQPPLPMSAEGDDLIVNADGTLYVNVRLDESRRFRTGQKKLRLVDSPTNDLDNASTGAEAIFNASGLNVLKKKTIFSTHPVAYQERSVQENLASSEFEVIPQNIGIAPGWGPKPGSCMAYSFLVKAPPQEDGIFLSSVDVFVSAKSSTMKLWFEIAEMDSAGNITRNRIPRSEVWFDPDDVPISTDGKTNPLNVKFPEPLFLLNDTQYALVIHTENVTPEYYLWVSKLGDTDVNTGLQVTGRPLSGTLYTTNNNMNWDIVKDMDLVVTFYRASFPEDTLGTAVIGSEPVEKFRLTNLSGTLSPYIGDVFVAGSRLTLSGANGSINIGDVFIGKTSGNTANVVTIDGSVHYMSNIGFTTSETVDVYRANGQYKGVSANVASQTGARGVLSKYKETSNVFTAHMLESTGGFRANDVIRPLRVMSASARIDTIENFRYSTVDFEPAYFAPFYTTISFEMKTYDTAGTEGSFTPINPEEIIYLNSEKALFARTNEKANLSSESTNQIKMYMRSLSDYVSPVFNMERSQMIYIDNLINSNTTNELSPSGGSLYNKYISKTVTLAEGQDAEDMLVILTAYRPPATDVKVWAKLLNGEDSENFEQTGWIELEKTEDGEITYSALGNRNDFKEFKYAIPTANTSNGVVQYTNSKGTTFSGYKFFAIKIGLTSDNSGVVPRVADLRVIALQV